MATTTSLLHKLLRLTNFRSPLLRAVVPGVGAAFALQAAVGLPSVLARSERFFDASGSATFFAVTLLSLYLPGLRARAAAAAAASPQPLLSILAAPHWRQIALSAAVAAWSVRLGAYLFARVLADGSDSRFDGLRDAPARFAGVWLAQAVWVSVCLGPVLLANGVPAAAAAATPPAAAAAYGLGLAVFAGGFALEVAADAQKSRWRRRARDKRHDRPFLAEGLWSRSRYPNYFGECALWTGVAVAAASLLVPRPAQLGLGLTAPVAGRVAVLAAAAASPAFVAFLLLRVSGVPLSERKYDARYGHRDDYRAWKQSTPKFFPKLF
ncbi:DUF1295-domain-containing protein [Durotheca rogersii]|uniref:DUF1295-domain-containing protein n=1 Tax=Durotheca rogersii TaxID=419775 RepID=UPI00221E4ABD|nr:DUF1295-domain-containing protein [Durotheca rogersii]KAI5861402.1 DUF1295-domain-containing protein [Durotheca rogersii]